MSRADPVRECKDEPRGFDRSPIIEWIAADNPLAARGFRVALDKLADTIGADPLIGVLKPHLASPPIRFLPIRGFPHVVVYTHRTAARR